MSTDQLFALVGSPNSGKTTLFNWLTGAKFKAVNYAGSTVETHRGQTRVAYGEPLTVLDTPGVYSLRPHGRDEEVTLETLRAGGGVKAVIAVVDGTQLNRQLYLVRQLQFLGVPLILAVTMVDLVKQSGRRLDLDKLSELIDAPVVALDGRLGGGVIELIDALRGVRGEPTRLAESDLHWSDERIEAEIAVAESWTKQVISQTPDPDTLLRRRDIDRVLLHPFWGILGFVLIMGTLFSSIFWLAAPAMDLIDQSVGAFAHFVEGALGTMPKVIVDLIVSGVIPGVGAVLLFVPQIFILFLLFTLLEDSGYLARAATIVDRPLNKIGLSGRAFVPILSGFACAVPAIMASRNIRSARERWITILIIPLMTCSARLPVYALLLGFLFHGRPGWIAGLTLTLLYAAGAFLGAVAAAIATKVRGPDHASPFLLELPIYRWPKVGFTLRIALRRTRSYLVKAGPTIFGFVLLLWVGTHVPYSANLTPAAQLEHSVVGQLGQAIEPVFRPMGLDWRVGLGMMSAFVAREVFVSSLAVIFSVADPEKGVVPNSLLERMRDAHLSDGSALFTTASVVGLIIYFMIALQCLSTTTVTWRELGSIKFALAQLVTYNVVAWVLAVSAVRALTALGF